VVFFNLKLLASCEQDTVLVKSLWLEHGEWIGMGLINAGVDQLWPAGLFLYHL
jgi:hypothetical protein